MKTCFIFLHCAYLWRRSEYPYGEYKVCNRTASRSCSEECGTAPGCHQYMTSHTCSILKFCPPEGADAQTVFLLKDQDAMDDCDFTDATEVGEIAPEDGCVEYAFEDDHELKEYHFSSDKDSCMAGQRLAVKIQDFALTADQCKAIGLTTSRLRNCDCRLQKKNSTLGEPCRTAFSDQCQEMVQEGDCCETGTCISKLEDFGHPLGQEAEMKRRDACNDDIPGLCYNEDGKGTDTNRLGSLNCCTKTCAQCGSEDNALAKWKGCTTDLLSNSTSNCGFLSRYDPSPHECDFSKCNEGDHWHTAGAAYLEASNGVGATTSDAASSNVIISFGVFCAVVTASLLSF